MKSMRLFLAVVVTAAFLIVSLQAQPRRAKNKWEVSFTVGWASSDDESFATSTLNGVKSVGLEQDSGPAFTLGVTDHVSRHVGAEVEYAFSDHDSTFFNLSPDLPALGFKQRLHRISYSAVIYPGNRLARIRPFGMVGAGAAYFQTSAEQPELALQNNVDLRSRWTFMYHYGGGVKWFLNERWALRFDVRNYVSNVPDYGLPRQDQSNGNGMLVPGFRPQGDFQHLYFGAGFTYALPGRP
ncbi:MAG TPA: outer membrane beta-barrel protein [Acidobacteriota bacterium]|nr:outer membrane beta-barrel protein [Acidobacteriota bacterium]